MVVHFANCKTKHKPPNNYKIYHRKWRISIFMGFQNANENEFHGFENIVIWLWKSFGKVLEICLKVFVRIMIRIEGASFLRLGIPL